MASKYEKAPTREQRKNIILMVAVLRDLLTKPEGEHYRHTTVNRCTVGCAARSKRFPLFNNNTRTLANGTILPVDGCGFDDLSDIARTVFGRDYYDRIVYGGESSGLMVYKQDNGLPQLKYIIDYIIKRYRISEDAIAKAMETAPVVVTTTVEVDTTKAKILARIEENAAYILSCNAVLARIHSTEVQAAKDEAITENRTLQKFV